LVGEDLLELGARSTPGVLPKLRKQALGADCLFQPKW